MSVRRECVPVGIAHLIGRKWFFPVIEEIVLSKNGISFNDLSKRIKYITPRNLVLLLSSMQKYSLLKQVQPYGRHRLYSITKQGSELYDVVEGLKDGMYKLPGTNPESCKSIKCTDCKWYGRDYWTSSTAKRARKARTS